MRRSVLLCATSYLFCCAVAAADDANPNFLPFGERAAFLANAGITSDRGESIYYNPANLARVGHPNLSVSGNLYVKFEYEADPLLVVGGEDQAFEASGFMSIPSTLVSTYQIGRWALGTAVLVPDALTFKNRVAFESASHRVTLLQEFQQQSLWFGGGIARELAPGLSAGLSLFVANEKESSFSFLRVEELTEPPVVGELTTNQDLSVWNAVAIAGVSWQASPALAIGVRTRVPPVKLLGGADIYQSALSSAVGPPAETTFEDVNVSRSLPWDLGIGVSFHPTPKLELVADVNVQLPATLTRVDDERIGREELELELAPRIGIGVDWQVASRFWLRLGGLYNRSAVPEPKAAGDEPREDYVGATGGVAWQSGRTQTALGGFFLHSSSDLLVQGADPVRKSDARGRLYGAILTVSYRL